MLAGRGVGAQPAKHKQPERRSGETGIDAGHGELLGRSWAVAQGVNLESQRGDTVAKLCVLGFEPLEQSLLAEVPTGIPRRTTRSFQRGSIRTASWPPQSFTRELQAHHVVSSVLRAKFLRAWSRYSAHETSSTPIFPRRTIADAAHPKAFPPRSNGSRRHDDQHVGKARGAPPPNGGWLARCRRKIAAPWR